MVTLPFAEAQSRVRGDDALAQWRTLDAASSVSLERMSSEVRRLVESELPQSLGAIADGFARAFDSAAKAITVEQQPMALEENYRRARLSYRVVCALCACDGGADALVTSWEKLGAACAADLEAGAAYFARVAGATSGVRAKAVADTRFVDYVRCVDRVHELSLQLRVAVDAALVASCAADDFACEHLERTLQRVERAASDFTSAREPIVAVMGRVGSAANVRLPFPYLFLSLSLPSLHSRGTLLFLLHPTCLNLPSHHCHTRSLRQRVRCWSRAPLRAPWSTRVSHRGSRCYRWTVMRQGRCSLTTSLSPPWRSTTGVASHNSRRKT